MVGRNRTVLHLLITAKEVLEYLQRASFYYFNLIYYLLFESTIIAIRWLKCLDGFLKLSSMNIANKNMYLENQAYAVIFFGFFGQLWNAKYKIIMIGDTEVNSGLS